MLKSFLSQKPGFRRISDLPHPKSDSLGMQPMRNMQPMGAGWPSGPVPHQPQHPHPPQHPQIQHSQAPVGDPRHFDNMVALVSKLGERTMLIPDPVIHNIIAQAGMCTSNPNVARLVGLAAEKFIVDTCKALAASSQGNVRLEHVKHFLAQKKAMVARPDFIVGPLAPEDPQPPPISDSFFDTMPF